MTTPDKVYIRFAPRGAAKACFTDRTSELVLSGPAGTGKSRGLLEKVHLCLTKYPDARALMLRKTRLSMTETCMWLYSNKVLHRKDHVKWHAQEQRWEYPNGSTFVVCGLDKPSKVLSSEYDMAYFNELTECSLTDWEMVSTRLRNFKIPYQQMLGDCNPDAPHHWIKLRESLGALKMLESRHEDNPVLFDAKKQSWTDKGKAYIAKLDALTGVRKLRLRYGIWAAAEGMIYEEFDRNHHVIDWFPVPESWPIYWVIDFGYTNPFVWQAWAEDPDGRLYMFREIYRTRRTVNEHCEDIKAIWQGMPAPRAVICDHDAEDRATFEQQMHLLTLPAYKSISPGIQAVKQRLKKAGDGRARIFYLRDSLHEPDPELVEIHHPLCTDQEFESYIWDPKRAGIVVDKAGTSDVPIDKYNHGMDASRYIVAFVDNLADDPQEFESVALIDDRIEISPY